MAIHQIKISSRAQLMGSFVAISLMLLAGITCVSVLAARLDEARADAEERYERSWVHSVLTGIEPDSGVLEISRRKNLAGAAKTALVVMFQIKSEVGVLAHAIKWTASGGYNGPIDLAIGVDLKGRIVGFRVLQHHETSGFGDVIGDPKSPWVTSFRGRSLVNPKPRQWQLRENGGAIDGISGATITANAVLNGLSQALLFIDQVESKPQ